MATTYEYSTEGAILRMTAKNSSEELVEQSIMQIPRGSKAHYSLADSEGSVVNPSVTLYDPEGFVIVEFSDAKPENIFKNRTELDDIYIELEALITAS